MTQMAFWFVGRMNMPLIVSTTESLQGVTGMGVMFSLLYGISLMDCSLASLFTNGATFTRRSI
jgi:hypothetical protein